MGRASVSLLYAGYLHIHEINVDENTPTSFLFLFVLCLVKKLLELFPIRNCYTYITWEFWGTMGKIARFFGKSVKDFRCILGIYEL